MTSRRLMESPPALTLGERAFALLQHLLPKHLLTRVIYVLARSELNFVKHTFLRIFLACYRIDMSEARERDPFAYRSFNDFFTRALLPDARPIDTESTALTSPVDGTVSQCGELDDDVLIQAKGRYYTLRELLADDQAAIDAYRGGSFACIYLAPYNYHRIHMPFDGSALTNTYVPGDLFSVNGATARAVPRLFARNERLICEFDTDHGRAAMILVGALFVGSIQTVHCGEVNPPPRARKAPQQIKDGIGRPFSKGEELGRFNMGSTVILLFQRDKLQWSAAMQSGATVRLGERIGSLRP